MDQQLRRETEHAVVKIDSALQRATSLLEASHASGDLPRKDHGFAEFELKALDQSLADLASRLWGGIPPKSVFAPPSAWAFETFNPAGPPLAWLSALQTGLTNAKAFFEVQLASQLPAPTGPATAAVKRKHVVLLIHGIRTQAEWEQRAAAVLETDVTIRVRPTRYEFLDVIRFLVPWATFRERPVARIVKLIRDELTKRPDHLSVVAHSFGTFIVSKILEREPDISFHRVIFCGSIVPDDFPWENYRHRLDSDCDGDWQVVNDCAMQDIWPVLAKSVTWGYGSSGRFGFGHTRVKDRYFNGGHSDFFTDTFMRTNWLPYLSAGRVVEGTLDRGTNPWWVSVLTVFKLRTLVVLSIGLVIGFAGYGLVGTSDYARLWELGRESTQQTVTLHTSDPLLNQFLSDLRRDVEAHDWDRVLSYFREVNFGLQVEYLGMTKAQYLAEGLGLGFVDNNLIPRPGDVTEFKGLNSIQSIDFTAISDFEEGEGSALNPEGNLITTSPFEWATVTGYATLFDGSTRKVTVEVVRKNTGGYHIGVSVG